MSTKCVVCGRSDTKVRPSGNDNQFTCKSCGKYFIDQVLQTEMDLYNEKQKAILSHIIRRQQNSPSGVYINKQNIGNLVNADFPSLTEQTNNLIIWLGENSHEYGQDLNLDDNLLSTVIGAKSISEYNFILSHLTKKKFIFHTSTDIQLTYDGWSLYDKIKYSSSSNSRQAFMAMKFGETELQNIYDNHFKKAVSATGFELVSLSDPEKQKAGIIDSHLQVEIRTSKFLLVDISHENLGAYWEAGFASGLGKPVIYTCSQDAWKKKKPHFDVEHHQTVIWDSSNPQEAEQRIKDIIRTTLPGEAKLID